MVGTEGRLLGDAGEAIRGRRRRQKTLKLSVSQTAGRAYSEEEKTGLLVAARSPVLFPALMLAFNAGMRDAGIRTFTSFPEESADRKPARSGPMTLTAFSHRGSSKKPPFMA
jgi:hypothetical protein